MIAEDYELFDKCIFYNILMFILLVSSYFFFVFECVIDNVCGCLSFELVMVKVMPYDPSHEEVYNAFIMKT